MRYAFTKPKNMPHSSTSSSTNLCLAQAGSSSACTERKCSRHTRSNTRVNWPCEAAASTNHASSTAGPAATTIATTQRCNSSTNANANTAGINVRASAGDASASWRGGDANRRGDAKSATSVEALGGNEADAGGPQGGDNCSAACRHRDTRGYSQEARWHARPHSHLRPLLPARTADAHGAGAHRQAHGCRLATVRDARVTGRRRPQSTSQCKRSAKHALRTLC